MTKYIIFASSDDGWIDSVDNNGSYTNARAGSGSPGKTATNGSTTALVGQIKVAVTPAHYNCREYFLRFDTSSILTTDIISSADAIFTVSSVSGWSASEGARLYPKAWVTPVDITDYVAGASLAALGAEPGFNESISANQKVHTPLNTFASNHGGVVAGGSSAFVMASIGLDAGSAPSGTASFAVFTSEAGSTAPVLVVQTFKPSTALASGRASCQLSGGQTVDMTTAGSPSGNVTPSLTYLDRFANTTHAISTTGMAFTPLDTNGWVTPEQFAIVADAYDNLYVIGATMISGTSALAVWFLKSAGAGSLSWSAPVLKASTTNINTTPLASISADIFKAQQVASGTVLPSGVEADRDIAVAFITKGQSSSSTIASRTRILILNTTGLHNNVAVGSTNAYGDSAWIYYDSGYNNTGLLPSDRFVGNVHIDLVAPPAGTYNPKSFAAAWYYEAGAGGGTNTVYFAVFIPLVVPATNAYSVTYASNLSHSSQSTVSQMSADSKVKVLYTKNAFYCIAGVFNGAPQIHSISNSGGYAINTFGTSGSTTAVDAAQSGAWDAFYDPVKDTIWLYTLNTGTAGEIDRIPFRCSTNVWDDANTAVFTSSAPTTGTNTYLKATKRTVDERSAHITVSNNNAGVLTTSYFVDSFNVVPNAPLIAAISTFDKGFAQAVSWTPSDQNLNDKQLKYEIEIDNNSTLAAAWRPGAITSAAVTATIPANTLAQNTTFRIRIRTYDEQNNAGTWSNYTVFSTSDIGSVSITNPVDNFQQGASANVTLSIQYNTTGAATISKYRIKLVRVVDSVVLQDTGDTTLAGGLLSFTAPVLGIPSDTPIRFDVYIINSAAQTTTTVSRLYVVSYLAPDQITNLTATVNGAQVDLAWTVPAASGSRPLPETIAIWRADSVNGVFQLIAIVYGTSQSFSDYVPQSGSTPYYFIVSTVSAGATSSNIATGGPVSFLGIAINSCNSSQGSPWNPPIMMFYGGAAGGEELAPASTKLQFQGRTSSVTVFGENQDHTLSAKATIPFVGNPISGIDDGNQQTMQTILTALLNMVEAHVVVCYRDSRGRKIFCNIAKYSVSDSDVGSDVAFDLAATDYAESDF